MFNFKLIKLRRFITKLFSLLVIGAIIFITVKNQQSFKKPLAENLTSWLKAPYNLVVNQKAAVDFKTIESDLSNQFIDKVKSLSSEADWLKFQDQMDQLKSQTKNSQEKLSYWLQADQKYTNFPAIKLILASLYYQQNDKQTALYYLNQAKQLDPNNKLLRVLAEIIR